MQTLTKVSALIASVVVATTVAADPQYQIYDIGVVQVGDTASQGFGVSPGGVAVGRSFRTNATQAFSWTRAGGLVGLPNLAGRAFAVSNSANDSGTVVGTGATTAFGSGRLPIVWQNGAVSQLPLPGGETLGDANHVNASGCRRRFGQRRKLATRGDLQRRQRDRHLADDARPDATFSRRLGSMIPAGSLVKASTRTTPPATWASFTTSGAPTLSRSARYPASTAHSLSA